MAALANNGVVHVSVTVLAVSESKQLRHEQRWKSGDSLLVFLRLHLLVLARS